MHQTAIDKQVEIIRKVTATASKSKESALKFLRDAKIITSAHSASSQIKKSEKK